MTCSSSYPAEAYILEGYLISAPLASRSGGHESILLLVDRQSVVIPHGASEEAAVVSVGRVVNHESLSASQSRRGHHSLVVTLVGDVEDGRAQPAPLSSAACPTATRLLVIDGRKGSSMGVFVAFLKSKPNLPQTMRYTSSYSLSL